jgi:NADPH:quinone reductase
MPDTTMNAWLLESFGEPEHFRKTSVAIPELRPNEVLIRVATTSINPVDCKIRRGERPAISPELPGILHGDVAGIVERCGADVSAFNPGDEVYGMVGGFKGLPGVLAD